LKNKDLNISIPKPCTQPWEQMTASGDGRFCNHCQKTVIDFTTWSDAALHQFLQGKREKVCGRFLASQLNRPITIPPQPHSALYRMVVVLGLTLMAAEHTNAQTKPPIVSTPANHKPGGGVMHNDHHSQGFGTLICEVRGKDYKILASATVWINTKGQLLTKAKTDTNGKLEIILPVGLFSIRAAYSDYDTSQYEVVSIKNEQTTHALLALVHRDDIPGSTIMTGDIMISEPATQKPKAKRSHKAKD